MVKIYYAISLYFISYSSRIYSGIYLHVRGHSVAATLNIQSTGAVQKGGTLGRSSSTAKGMGMHSLFLEGDHQCSKLQSVLGLLGWLLVHSFRSAHGLLE